MGRARKLFEPETVHSAIHRDHIVDDQLELIEQSVESDPPQAILALPS